MVSVGDDDRDDRDDVLDFYVSGNHHTQTLRRNTLPGNLARAAMRHFLAVGRLSPDVTREEV